MADQTFDAMDLKPELLKTIEEKGFEKPTPIQSGAIPPAVAGRDIMGQAQTGTGKTAAFGIPILNRIEKNQGLQGLVMCPTRELAVQVGEELSFLGRRLPIHTLAVYGGQSIAIQLRGLRRKPEIVVGTPGRLIDHLQRGTVSLETLRFVVLDEADEMLDMGFLPDIEKIMQLCPQERQTFLFSATLVPEIRKLGRQFMKEPEEILIAPEQVTVPLTQQYYYRVNPSQKLETICRIIDVEQPAVSLIFCRTKKGADELSWKLNSRGYAADALHGDMSQRERDNVMDRFRNGNVQILVATDLAARGLDVELVTHVFNFDIPDDPDSYVHRIGRTGRAGKEGVAITLVEPRQITQLKMIERYIGKKIRHQVLPSLQDAIQRRQQSLEEKVLEASRLDSGVYKDMAASLLDGNDPQAILAAALKLLSSDEPELETAQVEVYDRGTAHIELPLGKRQGIYPRRLVEFIAANTSLRPSQIGDIEVHSNSTLVEVPVSNVDEVYGAFEQHERNRRNHWAHLNSGRRQRKKAN